MKKLTMAMSAFILGLSAMADVVYVSPAGNDAADGSRSTPLRTLEAARNRLRKAPEGQRELVMLAGDYFLADTFRLSNEDNGLLLRGEKPGVVTLWGGEAVTGWKKDPASGFWFATVSPKAAAAKFRMLLKDGAPLPVARYPGGTNRFAHLTKWDVKIMSSLQGGWQRKPTEAERSVMAYDPKDIPDSLDLMNADLRLFHMWSDSLCTVSNVNRAAHTLVTARPASWAMGAAGRNRYEILNVREGMLEDGQWYCDRAAGCVWYRAKTGEDPNRAKFVVPVLPSLIEVSPCKKGRYHRELWSRGLAFKDFTVSSAQPSVSEMASFGGSAVKAAIEVNTSDGLVVEGVNVLGTAGAGMNFTDITHARIVNCDIRETGARGAGIGGWAGAGDNLFASNRICDAGLVYRSSAAFFAGGTNSIFRANEICRIPYCGIIGSGTGNLYEENYIHHVMQVLHDGGAIYGNLTRCTLRRNVVHDITPDGKGYGVHAYYADEGSVDCVIEDNYAEGVAVPTHQHMTKGTVVRGNTLVNKDGDLRISFARSYDCAFSNNLLVAGGKVELGEPDAVPHWGGNRLIRPADPTDPKSRRRIELWNPERPQLKRAWLRPVPRMSKPPKLDGVFDNGEWPLYWNTLDRSADRHASCFTAATVRMGYDDENLYVSFFTSAFKFCKLTRGEKWGEDDGVEIVFEGGRRVRGYFSGKTEVLPAEFASAGVEIVGGQKPGFDPKRTWENHNIGHYEIKIPFKALGIEKPAEKMSIPFNACCYVSDYHQYKYIEGTCDWPDGTKGGETPAKMTLGK